MRSAGTGKAHSGMLSLSRAIISVLMALLLALTAGLLSGCGLSEEKAEEGLQAWLDNELGPYKEQSGLAINGLDLALLRVMQASPQSQQALLGAMGITSNDIARYLVQDFDYSLRDVSVDGDRVSATLTVVRHTLGDLDALMNTAVEEAEADPSLTEGMTQEQAGAWLGERVKALMAEEEPDETDVEILFERNEKDRVWEPTASTKSAIGDLLVS